MDRLEVYAPTLVRDITLTLPTNDRDGERLITQARSCTIGVQWSCCRGQWARLVNEAASRHQVRQLAEDLVVEYRSRALGGGE